VGGCYRAVIYRRLAQLRNSLSDGGAQVFCHAGVVVGMVVKLQLLRNSAEGCPLLDEEEVVAVPPNLG